MDQYDKGVIKHEWTCQDVLRFLYFAESQVVKNAIIDLKIDGKSFLEIDKREFAAKLKKNSNIPLGVSNAYFNKIV